MNKIIEINNVTKYFGKFKALDNVNFDLREGEILGFIGPNGSGKSTTIKALLGIIKASSGNSTIFGLDSWQDNVAIHKRLAYVPGDVNLWPNLSGGETIDILLGFHGQKRTEKTNELIKRFDLDTSKKARSYSKGNRQKIALIVALSSEADVYIFDEPTSGLDPLMEQIFQEYVLDLKAKGKSILLSSHILSEVEKLCDRITIIKEGKIIETGSLTEMRHLTRTLINVTTFKSVTGLDNLLGIHSIKQDDNKLSLQVDADYLNEVISYLTSFGIITLNSMPPTLEDLFIRYYEASNKVGI